MYLTVYLHTYVYAYVILKYTVGVESVLPLIRSYDVENQLIVFVITCL